MKHFAIRALPTSPNPSSDRAMLRLRPDGSFVLAGALHGDASLWRVEYYPTGLVSILTTSGTMWREATVRTGHSRWQPNRLCLLQAARSSTSGGIEADSTWWSSSGERKKRTLMVSSGNARRWTFDQRFSNGSRLEGEGKKARGGPASVVQRRLTKGGKPVWTSVSNSSSPQADGVRTVRTETNFTDGGKASSIMVVSPMGGLMSTRSETKYGGGPFAGSSSETSVHIDNDGNLVTQTVVTFPDGSMQITTDTESEEGFSKQKDTTTIGISSDGRTGVVATSSSTSGTDEATGVTSGTFTDQYTNEAGETVEQSVGWASSPAGTSVTTSTPTADGGFQLETVTTDSDGAGTNHTTTYDKDGNQTSDTTTPVDPSSSKQPDQSGDEPAQQPDQPEDTDHNSGDDKGTGQDTDKGMDWEGGSDEGPISVLPKHTASILDVVEAPHGDAGDGEEGLGSISDRVAKGLIGRVIAPGTKGDGGYGDSGGSESFDDISLNEASILSVVKVRPPTDDWGEWTDPRAHVAYVGSLIAVLSNTPGATRHGLSKALLSLHLLSAEITSQLANN